MRNENSRMGPLTKDETKSRKSYFRLPYNIPCLRWLMWEYLQMMDYRQILFHANPC